MKIAITGGTAGIGQALGNLYEQHGHEVLRLSRRNGNNIRSIPKIAAVIEPCDVFINNAQAGFAQTELLFEMAKRWQNTGKRIVNISTMMTQDPVCILPGLDMSEYYIQKCALELAVKELKRQNPGIKFDIVRPGNIATDATKTVPPAMDVGVWAEQAYKMLEGDFASPEFSLGPK
jgi:NAD(P)-dependent dehydrogenase (short-subunit alcohol dehydrogenase family)